MILREGVTLFTQNALTVLRQRYLLKDSQGKVVETPAQMLARVAHPIAAVERHYNPHCSQKKWEEKFYGMMARLEFLPNSPMLMNIGTPLGQLAACFVLPVEDSMESIFEAVKNAAIIHKTGGGTGFSFSRLRPKNDPVKTTHGVSSGPVSFMRVFNAATEAVKQGGRRRGANMGILRVDHPDIEEFIESKKDVRELINFNISVGLTRAFMRAVKKGKAYALKNPRTGKKVKELDARTMFKKIARRAWQNGEPGVIFLDRIEQSNPTPVVGHFESTNPCGEQPLLPFESCTLGSINVAQFVADKKIDWDRLKETVHLAVRFLDNVIEANKYPLPEIERQTKANRKIGVGVMGFADLLIELKISYDSQAAVAIASKLMRFINEESKKESHLLAKERGAFPNFKKSIFRNKMSLRNATTTTVAPTGTLSLIAGCGSGIEPLFALVYEKNVLDRKKIMEANLHFMKEAKRLKLSRKIMAQIAKSGTLQPIKEIPASLKAIFKTSRDIAPKWHVKIQAAFQAHTDNAVSKTINFSKRATMKEVENAFLLAYALGCKGITIYRDTSRPHQVLSLAAEE